MIKQEEYEKMDLEEKQAYLLSTLKRIAMDTYAIINTLETIKNEQHIYEGTNA